MDSCMNPSQGRVHVERHVAPQQPPLPWAEVSVQVRAYFGKYDLVVGYPQTIHTPLWITLWTHPFEGVDNLVGNTVHGGNSARQRMPSSVI